MDIEAIMARLAEASDTELSEARDSIKAAALAVENDNTEANVAKLEKFAEAMQSVNAELSRRAELGNRGASALAVFADDDAEKAAADKAAAEKADADKAEAEAAKAAAEGVEGEGTEGGEGGEGTETVTASGVAKLGTIAKAAAKVAPKPKTQYAGVVTAVTRDPGSGAQFTRETFSTAMVDRAQALAKTGVQGRHVISRTEFSYPENRTLSSEVSAGVNTRRIEAVTRGVTQESLVAAGGLCAPLETIYDIDTIGVTSRPVRDALNPFRVDRGGIQYRMPMDALTMTDGLGVWTAAMDAAVGVVEDPDVPDPAKTCAIIECPDLEDAIVDAIYLCLQYPNFTARFDQEWVTATTDAAQIAHARFAENRLLAKLNAGSKVLFTPKKVSAVRDVLVTLDKTVAYYRNRHRLDSMVPLRLILPRWVLDLFRADIARGLGSAYSPELLAVTDAMILTWFRARGVNVTFHLDGLAAQDNGPTGADTPNQFYATAATQTEVPGFIDKIDSLLFAEGDWLFLDGGTLDLGLVRDSTLNRTNRYQTFVETWEGTAFRGIESLRLVMEVQPTGSVVGTIDGSAFVD